MQSSLVEDEASSYSELKTPTQSAGHFITPTGNLGLTQSKKIG